MLRYSVEFDGPIAIRYPRGQAYEGLQENRADIEYGKSEWISEGKDVCLAAVGSMVRIAIDVKAALEEQGLSVSLVNARFVKPIDEEMIEKASKKHKLVVTMEENVLCGGYGENVRQYMDTLKSKAKLLNIAIPDTFVEHGSVDLLLKSMDMDAEGITKRVLDYLK